MIALWIVLGILGLLLLFLLLPAGIELHYHEGRFTAALRFLCFHLSLIPLPEALTNPKPSHKKKTSAKNEPAEKKPALRKRRPFMDYLQLANDLLPVVGEALHRMIGGMTVKECRILLITAAEDAGDTAIRCARANALLYGIYTFLARHIKFKEFRADVRMDYLHGPEAETADADLLLRARPLTFLSAGIRLLWRGGNIYLDFKKRK